MSNINISDVTTVSIRVHYMSGEIKQVAFPTVKAIRLAAADSNIYNLITDDDRFIGLNKQLQFIVTANRDLALSLPGQLATLRDKSFFWHVDGLGCHRKALKTLLICFIELLPLLPPLIPIIKEQVINNIPSLNQGIVGAVAAAATAATAANNAFIPRAPIITAQQATRLLNINNTCTGNTYFNTTDPNNPVCSPCLNNSYANSTHTACISCAGSVCGAFSYCYGPTNATNVPCVVDPETGVFYADCSRGGNKCQGQCQGSCGAGEIFGYSCTLGSNGNYGCHLTQGWLLAIWIIGLIILIIGIIILIVWLTKRNKVPGMTEEEEIKARINYEGSTGYPGQPVEHVEVIRTVEKVNGVPVVNHQQTFAIEPLNVPQPSQTLSTTAVIAPIQTTTYSPYPPVIPF